MLNAKSWWKETKTCFSWRTSTAASNQEKHLYRQTFVLKTLQTYLNSHIFPPNKTRGIEHNRDNRGKIEHNIIVL